MTGARAAFIDRDGTINQLVADPVSGRPESPLRPVDVKLIPGAAHAIRALSRAGWLVVGVSNQPAAAKGIVSVQMLAEVQACVLGLLAAEGARFDDFRICPHHPDGVIPELTARCDCRKPRPGMLLLAAQEHAIELPESWMVGDTTSDMLAGRAAGCRTVLIEHQPSAHKRTDAVEADAVVPDLAAAVPVVLSSDRVN